MLLYTVFIHVVKIDIVCHGLYINKQCFINLATY